tara:strand:+ start:52025 stop:52234 length:210 start_codon:yes stop_codon:yes gene_type:complete
MGLFSKLFGGGKRERIKALLEQGAVIIDVRNPGEFASRNYKGSINIPLPEIPRSINKIKAKKTNCRLLC